MIAAVLLRAQVPAQDVSAAAAIVRAGPGSGKTKVIVEGTIRLDRRWRRACAGYSLRGLQLGHGVREVDPDRLQLGELRALLEAALGAKP